MRQALFAALWLNFVQILTAMAMLSVPVMAPAIAADLGLSPQALGPYMALAWCGAFATLFAAGHLTARFGALRVSQMCLALCGAGMLTAAAGPPAAALAPFVFIAAGVLIGMGHGAETPASSDLLARITPPRHQPLIFSLKQTGVQIGGIASGFAFPALLVLLGWRASLAAAGAVLMAATVLLERPRRRLEPARRAARPGVRQTFVQAFLLVLRDWRILRLAIAASAYVSSQICLNTFLVAFLVAERGVSLALAGSLLAAAQAGGLVGRLAWGAIAGRAIAASAVLALIGVAIVLCALLLGLYGTRMPVPLLASLCFAFGFTASGWNGVQIAEVARLVPPDQVARVMGATFVLGMLGLVLAPLAFGAMAAAASFGAAYIMIGALALVGVLVMLPLGRSSARRG